MRRPWLLACCLWAVPLPACSGGLRAVGHADGGAGADGPVVPADLAPVEVATIVRRGTNYGQLSVVVYSDASTVRAFQPRAGNQLDASAGPNLPPGSPAVVKLLQDLALVEDVSDIRGPPTCVGDSVSFGTRTYLTVGNKTGGNLQCPDNPTPAQAALAADCVDLTQ